MVGSGLLSCSGTRGGAGKERLDDFSSGFSNVAFGDFGDLGFLFFSTGGKTKGEELLIVAKNLWSPKVNYK